MKLFKRILVVLVVLVVLLSAVVVVYSSFGALIQVAPSFDGAQSAMEDAGYTSVIVEQGNPLLAGTFCADDETLYFKVTSATNNNGVTVTNAYVCAGTTRGYVIRYH